MVLDALYPPTSSLCSCSAPDPLAPGGADVSFSPDPDERPADAPAEQLDVLPADPVADTSDAVSAAPAEPGITREAPATDQKTFIGPRGGKRRGIESVFVRLVATSGIVGICVALAAILGTQDVAYWIIGLAVSLVSVVLAAILWSSRTL